MTSDTHHENITGTIVMYSHSSEERKVMFVGQIMQKTNSAVIRIIKCRRR